MIVECTRHLDASEPDGAGMYDYHYEYDIYRFTDGAVCFAARNYVERVEEAHFVSVEVKGTSRRLINADLAHPLFLAAVAHFRGEGKTDLHWLSGRGNGYEPIPEIMQPRAEAVQGIRRT